MKGYQCNHISCALTDLDRFNLRAAFNRKKEFVTTLFGFERKANLYMLIGEVNVLNAFGVFTDYQAEQERIEIMNYNQVYF